MSWEETNRRQRLIREALEEVARTGDPGVMTDHPAVAAFGDLDTLLLVVHRRWADAVLARVDAVLEDGAADPARELTAHLGELDGSFGGTRLVLDAFAEHPRLAAVQERLRLRVRADLGVDLGDVGPRAIRPARRYRWSWRQACTPRLRLVG